MKRRLKEPNPMRGVKGRRAPQEPAPKAPGNPNKAWAPPRREPKEQPLPKGLDPRKLTDLIKKLLSERKEKYDLEAEVKERNISIDALMKDICAIMEKFKLQNVKLEGIGTCSRTAQPYPSIVPGHEDEVFTQLRKLGYGSTIKLTVHSKTLQSIINELKLKNQKPPKGVTVFEKPYVRITRPNNKAKE